MHTSRIYKDTEPNEEHGRDGSTPRYDQQRVARIVPPDFNSSGKNDQGVRSVRSFLKDNSRRHHRHHQQSRTQSADVYSEAPIRDHRVEASFGNEKENQAIFSQELQARDLQESPLGKKAKLPPIDSRLKSDAVNKSRVEHSEDQNVEKTGYDDP